MAQTVNRSQIHLGYIDLNKNELRNGVIQGLGTAPSTPSNGQVWYLTSDHRLHLQANGVDRYQLTDQDIATLRDFSLSTGTRASTAISDFTEAAQDAAGAALTAGTHTGATVTYGATQDTANRIDIAVTDSPLLGGQTLAQVRARSSHTGTQTASTISDFDTQVRTNRLDQMAAPTASVPLNNQKITGLLAGTASTDAVNFQQLQDAKNQVDRKDSVRVATSTNVTIASPGASLDGVAMATGESFLAYGQTTGSENGIYVWNGAATPATRREDANASAEVTAGLTTVVEEGTQADKRAILTTNNPITLGSTSLTFTFETTGESIVAGNGLTKTGSTIDIVPAASGGITVAADSISVDTAIVLRKAAGALTGGATSEVVTHNLNTRDVRVTVRNNNTPWDEIDIESEATTVNTVTLRGAANLTAGYRWIVFG